MTTTATNVMPDTFRIVPIMEFIAAAETAGYVVNSSARELISRLSQSQAPVENAKPLIYSTTQLELQWFFVIPATADDRNLKAFPELISVALAFKPQPGQFFLIAMDPVDVGKRAKAVLSFGCRPDGSLWVGVHYDAGMPVDFNWIFGE